MSRGERILQGSLALHHETLQVAWEASLSRIRGVEYQEAHERYIIIRFELDSGQVCKDHRGNGEASEGPL